MNWAKCLIFFDLIKSESKKMKTELMYYEGETRAKTKTKNIENWLNLQSTKLQSYKFNIFVWSKISVFAANLSELFYFVVTIYSTLA